MPAWYWDTNSLIFHGTRITECNQTDSHLILIIFQQYEMKRLNSSDAVVLHWSLSYSFHYFMVKYITDFQIINTKVCQKYFALMNLKIFYHLIKSN